VVTTLAGGVGGTNCTFADGVGSNVGFCYPEGVAIDASNNILVADGGNGRIRKVTTDGGTRICSLSWRTKTSRQWCERLSMFSSTLLFFALHS
jgi:hypothetical protein